MTYKSGLLVISLKAPVATLVIELRGVINMSLMPVPIAPVILPENFPMTLPGFFKKPPIFEMSDYNGLQILILELIYSTQLNSGEIDRGSYALCLSVRPCILRPL
jgi:hypothetical protein